MKIRVISVGNICPVWIRQGFDEYDKRMHKEMPLSLTEIAAPKHHQHSSKINELEAKKILERIQASDWVIALDEKGQHYSSPALARQLEDWRELGKDVVLSWVVQTAWLPSCSNAPINSCRCRRSPSRTT